MPDEPAAKSTHAVPVHHPPGAQVDLHFAEYEGLTGIVLRHLSDGTHVVRRVTEGSPAEEQGAPIGASLIQINGESVEGRTPADVTELAQARPLHLVVRVPSERPLGEALAVAAPSAQRTPAPPPLGVGSPAGWPPMATGHLLAALVPMWPKSLPRGRTGRLRSVQRPSPVSLRIDGDAPIGMLPEELAELQMLRQTLQACH